ncbi:MAG TPA: DUF2933 domain-containing protein [Acidimicrobiales bacterium]|nr:DUF2933 domain-containing protein [Acidimicrobiales bacterium]
MNTQRYIGPALAVIALVVVLRFLGVSLAASPFLLVLLVCPLMMLFMMRGMNHGGDDSDESEHDHSAHSGHGRPSDR